MLIVFVPNLLTVINMKRIPLPLDIGQFTKHRKNCEFCPVSLFVFVFVFVFVFLLLRSCLLITLSKYPKDHKYNAMDVSVCSKSKTDRHDICQFFCKACIRQKKNFYPKKCVKLGMLGPKRSQFRHPDTSSTKSNTNAFEITLTKFSI